MLLICLQDQAVPYCTILHIPENVFIHTTLVLACAGLLCSHVLSGCLVGRMRADVEKTRLLSFHNNTVLATLFRCAPVHPW